MSPIDFAEARKIAGELDGLKYAKTAPTSPGTEKQIGIFRQIPGHMSWVPLHIFPPAFGEECLDIAINRLQIRLNVLLGKSND